MDMRRKKEIAMRRKSSGVSRAVSGLYNDAIHSSDNHPLEQIYAEKTHERVL